MNSRRTSRYKLLTFIISVIVGIVVADATVSAGDPVKNTLVAAGVAAGMAIVLTWLGGRFGRREDER